MRYNPRKTNTSTQTSKPARASSRRRAARTIPAPLPLGPSGAGMRLNEDKCGVELRFASRPVARILDELKDNGWRWSHANLCWYHRDTPENRAFADKFVNPPADAPAMFVIPAAAPIVGALTAAAEQPTTQTIVDVPPPVAAAAIDNIITVNFAVATGPDNVPVVAAPWRTRFLSRNQNSNS
jgi:hypothetical protein